MLGLNPISIDAILVMVVLGLNPMINTSTSIISSEIVDTHGISKFLTMSMILNMTCTVEDTALIKLIIWIIGASSMWSGIIIYYTFPLIRHIFLAFNLMINCIL